MEFDLEASVALLERFPGALAGLLGGLPEVWTQRPEGDGTWTAAEVVGHLVHTERVNWIARARIVLESGEQRVFPPLNREAHRDGAAVSLGEQLEEFARLRAANLEELRGWRLGEVELRRTGAHPALGAVTLAELLAAWTVHDLTHLHQVSRILAAQYREAVGPFARFLGVLQCDGHSRPA